MPSKHPAACNNTGTRQIQWQTTFSMNVAMNLREKLLMCINSQNNSRLASTNDAISTPTAAE